MKMAKVNDFINMVLQIEGVMNYLLVNDDGHTMANNFEDPDTLAPIILFNGLNSKVIKPMMGLSYFKYLSCTLKNDEKFLIVPMGRYFLGISHNADAHTPDVVESLEKLVEQFSRKKVKNS
jgi:hypothetical protein